MLDKNESDMTLLDMVKALKIGCPMVFLNTGWYARFRVTRLDDKITYRVEHFRGGVSTGTEREMTAEKSVIALVKFLKSGR